MRLDGDFVPRAPRGLRSNTKCLTGKENSLTLVWFDVESEQRMRGDAFRRLVSGAKVNRPS